MKRRSREKNTQPTDATGPEVPEGVLQAALNGVVAEGLQSAVAGVGVLLFVFALGHIFFPMTETGNGWIIAVALASAVLMGGLYFVMRRVGLPIEWAHPLGAGVVLIALANILLRYYLTSDDQQIAYLTLLLAGAGYVLISTRWLISIAVITMLSWAITAVLMPDPLGWLANLFLLLAGLALMAIIHVARRRSAMRLERLRIRDARYKAELEVVLKTTEEAQRSLATSIAVGQRIVSILDLDVLLSQVAYLIQQRFNCYFVGVFLLDENGEYVVFRAGTGELGRSLIQQNFRLKVGEEGIIGWTAKYRRPACVDDITKDARFVGHESLPNIRSELALPLEMGTTLLGVLDMESEQVATFREDDVPFLQLLADQVATAIQNASLFEKEKTRRRLAETLYQVGRALSGTLNLAEEFDLILELLADIVPYDRAAVMLRSGDELEFSASRGFPPGFEHYRIAIKKGDIFEEVYRTKKPLAIADVAQRPDWIQASGLPVARAWLGIPLIRSTEVLGMLSLVRETPDAYSNDEVTLASTFAGQAAIALHNARLYDQITRFSQDLEKLVRQRTEALQQAYNDLERMDRAKSDFIGVASHELRTPLTLLRGYSQMLLDDAIIKNNPLLYQQISGIQTGAIRLHEIVESMLDVAKIDNRELQLHPVPLQLPTLIRSVYESLEAAMAERNLTFTDEYDSMLSIDGDLEALRKVFYQLIVNAIKFTPDGGRVSISGRRLELGERGMLDGGVEIVVSDTGIGIAPNMQELIFYKFYQTGELALHSTGKTKFKGGGPGLGLAIAKGIVEAHNGKLWVESPGFDERTCPGSQFHIVLPIHQKAPYVH